MAFFLLGRVDDTLSLLCPDTFSSRQDALAALSRVTSEPGFDLWDAEVLLFDTDAGTPVLLMRPQVAEALVIEPDAVSEDIVAEDSDDEPLETVVVDEPLEIEAEIETDAATDADAETGADAETDADAEVEIEIEDGDESPTLVTDDDSVPDVRVEAAPDVDVVSPVDGLLEEEVALVEEAIDEPDAAATLRDALSRTAAQMEAEGIVAPDSIGAPESSVVEVDSVTVVDKEWPWDVAGESEPSIAPEVSFVPDQLEEPSLDDASILRGSIDDDTFAAARPLIMGSYAEPREEVPASDGVAEDLPVEPMGLTELETVVVPLPSASSFAVPVVGDASDIIELELPDEDAPVPNLPAQTTEAETEDAADQDISDFILDLGSVPHAEPAAEVTQVFDDMPGVVENTCDDCIYEDTCPNRDQRLPKDCGSFSWR